MKNKAHEFEMESALPKEDSELTTFEQMQDEADALEIQHRVQARLYRSARQRVSH